MMPAGEASQDNLASALYQREQRILSGMPPVLTALPTDKLSLQQENLVGVKALRRLLDKDNIPCVSADAISRSEVISAPSLEMLVDDIARDGHGLVMLMGKGGVGKTTLAAAVAVALADKGFDVHLTTSDPAAHLENTLNGQCHNLQVSRIDPHTETERYREHVLATKGNALDTQGRALLEEDLRSPCTEEIAVFQAFSRVIREAGKRFVVMDTAPTGHTLLLLDATGAYHREVAKRMGDKGHYLTPMMQLQDPERTKIMLVTLPETTPVLEAAGLQEDLRRAGIEPWAWLINNSLVATETTSPLLLTRAAHEATQINKVRTELASRMALIPLQQEAPTGIEQLQRLIRQAEK